MAFFNYFYNIIKFNTIFKILYAPYDQGQMQEWRKAIHTSWPILYIIVLNNVLHELFTVSEDYICLHPLPHGLRYTAGTYQPVWNQTAWFSIFIANTTVSNTTHMRHSALYFHFL